MLNLAFNTHIFFYQERIFIEIFALYSIQNLFRSLGAQVKFYILLFVLPIAFVKGEKTKLLFLCMSIHVSY